ncbi:MAG: type II toxin-antitoxin system VapC family toxin [Actinobacteria bacterium]|nr:type II toxin-antitoxin system VapC family toxin [Actinomycetota bacterium]
MSSAYFDTSALAKWYVNESRSEDVEEYVRSVYPVYVSLLTKIEMKSLAARRVREGHFDLLAQGKVLATFEGDIAGGHLVLLPHTVESFLIAESLLGSHPEVPLHSLDAMHLGIMRAAGVMTLATADRVMAQAAEALGMECETFF